MSSSLGALTPSHFRDHKSAGNFDYSAGYAILGANHVFEATNNRSSASGAIGDFLLQSAAQATGSTILQSVSIVSGLATDPRGTIGTFILNSSGNHLLAGAANSFNTGLEQLAGADSKLVKFNKFGPLGLLLDE